MNVQTTVDKLNSLIIITEFYYYFDDEDTL